jgi:hypothetical protein
MEVDFEDAVNSAFGKENNPPPPPPKPNEKQQNPLSSVPPKKTEKMKKSGHKEKKERIPLFKDEPPPSIDNLGKHMDIEELESKRQEIYNQLNRYIETFPKELEGLVIKENMTYDELTFTLQVVQKRVSAKQEINLLRTGLVSTCFALEYGVGMIPGKPIKLNGFSANISNSIEQFDDVLKQLMCKYGGGMTVSPEVMLAFALVRVGIQTHVSNSFQGMFSNMPNMSESSEQPPPPPTETTI